MNIAEKWSEIECKNILSFLGYGLPSGPIWFVGREEGLGGKMSDGNEVRRNLHARGKWQKIMDLYDAHLTLTEQGRRIDISKPRKGSVTVWLWMSRIARAYEGHSDWRDREKARIYMRTRLGRRDGCTFITELSPVPKRNLADRSWLPEFMSQKGAKDLLELRREELRCLVQSEQSKLVICFGTMGRDSYSQLLGFEKWDKIAERVWKSPKENYFLLPFFGNGQITEGRLAMLVDSKEFRSLRKTK